MVLGINSCSQNNNKVISHKENVIETTYMKNNTITTIINGILLENNNTKKIDIELIDDDEQSLLLFKVWDSLYDCKNIKAIYDYRDTRLMFFDNSEQIDFETIVDLHKTLSLELCKSYIMKNDNIIIDSEKYIYKIDREGNIFYPNGDSLDFKNGKLKLKLWY